MNKKIIIGSDHAGFILKNKLAAYLDKIDERKKKQNVASWSWLTNFITMVWNKWLKRGN